ncbi:Murein DD-endopeptidase MepM [Anaerolineales bacterium]|nr:Murein DD-endopeptidase MepM [Anaerolineales bacterium]
MTKHFISFLLLLSLLIFPLQSINAQEVSGPIYIVQPGDSLSSIAVFFSISQTDLMTANNITDPNQLDVGQQLVIPGLNGITGVINTQRINFGDSFRSLTRRTQVPLDMFKKLNHIVSPSEFYVGTNMIVPVQEGNQGLNKRISTKTGESLLEAAAKQNTDVWTVAYYNDLQGSWDAVPGDTLFAPGESVEQTVSGLPSAFVSAQIRDLPLKQGGTGVIRVKTASPDVTLGGILVDHQLHFFPLEDGTQVALQGVHALLHPGVYPLRMDATLPDGSTQSYEQNVLIVSGNYPDDPLLYVDPKTIDPAETEPELNKLVEITSPVTPEKLWSGDFYSPASQYAESTYFTSRFGNRRTYIGLNTELSVQGFHTGLDFGGGTGLPITAPARGKVIVAENWTVRGGTIIIDHGWGVYSGIWHQSKFLAQVGDVVEQGQVIGEVGGTGRVTGPHLHWELWVNGIQVDPLDWLTNTYP